MLAECIHQPYNKIRFINALPCQSEGPCGIQNSSGVPFSNCRLPFPASVFFCARPTQDALGGLFIARNRLHCEHFSNSDKFTIGRRGPLSPQGRGAMVRTTRTQRRGGQSRAAPSTICLPSFSSANLTQPAAAPVGP